VETCCQICDFGFENWNFFCFQLQLGVDESYTLSVSKASESSVAWEATIEVCCLTVLPPKSP